MVSFRAWLIGRDLDRPLIERTVELAAATEGSGVRALRAALDSSPRQLRSRRADDLAEARCDEERLPSPYTRRTGKSACGWPCGQRRP